MKWRCYALEGLIKDIVDADKIARNRVNDKIHERDNVHSQLLAKRDEIVTRYREVSKKQIEERRSQLEQQLQEAAVVEEARYQNTLEQLEKQVEKNKNEWVSVLTAQCLKRGDHS